MGAKVSLNHGFPSGEDTLGSLDREGSKEQAESSDRKLGQILQAEGLVDMEELQRAFDVQGSSRDERPLGQILVDQGTISLKQLNFVLDRFDKRPRLGEILLRSGAITREMLEAALERHNRSGVHLGEALVELNFLTEEGMRQTLCTQLNVPFVNVADTRIDRNLAKLINKSFARRHHIVPIARIGNTLTLAMDDPTETDLIRELERITGLSINVVTSTRSSIQKAFSRVYEKVPSIDSGFELQLIEESNSEPDASSEYLESHQSRKATSLVGQIIGIGITHAASDIHIETTDRRVLVRYRIDGVLQEIFLGSLEEELNNLRREVISRIKILGSLDIAERRRPQDGSFRARLAKDGQVVKIDFRISIVPGYYGENVVLRILDTRNAPKSVGELGFSKRINDTLTRLLSRNTGILLVTGPTGSGKSTTLYGALMTAYRPGIKVLTAEDPIEYVYEKLTQCEVNPKIGNTFAKFIRAFLRQDPEVIMVGEVRDSETADMAFRAAQTGHLVLTTLHTNDSIGAVTRLRDLGVDSSLLASCLLGVLSQRLVRQVCPSCKVEDVPAQNLLAEFFDDPPPAVKWVRGQGCSMCNHTGFAGRMAVAELWTPNQADSILINRDADLEELARSASDNNVSMAEDAMEKLFQGKTNLEELIRTLPYSAIYQFRQVFHQTQTS